MSTEDNTYSHNQLPANDPDNGEPEWLDGFLSETRPQVKALARDAVRNGGYPHDKYVVVCIQADDLMWGEVAKVVVARQYEYAQRQGILATPIVAILDYRICNILVESGIFPEITSVLEETPPEGFYRALYMVHEGGLVIEDCYPISN